MVGLRRCGIGGELILLVDGGGRCVPSRLLFVLMDLLNLDLEGGKGLRKEGDLKLYLIRV